MSKLIGELRKKYRTPQEVLRVLGLDESLIALQIGPDVIVGDSKLEIKEADMPKKALSPMAQLAKGALMAALKPVLAKDAKFDYGLLSTVTKKNWAERRPAILAAIKPKLATDAALGDIVALLDTLEKAEGTEDEEPPVDTPPAIDADPIKAACDMFKAKGASDEEVGAMNEMLKKMNPAKDADLDDDAKAKAAAAEKAAKDAEEPKVTAKAMDAALAKTATDVEARTVARLNGAAEAREKVQPYVGRLALSLDSAEAVYRAALKQLNVAGHDTIHASALSAVLEAQPRPDARRVDKTTIAQDAAHQASFAERFPTVAGMRTI